MCSMSFAMIFGGSGSYLFFTSVLKLTKLLLTAAEHTPLSAECLFEFEAGHHVFAQVLFQINGGVQGPNVRNVLQ